MAKFPVDTAVVVRDLVWNNPGGTVTKTRGALADVVDAPTMGTYDPRKANQMKYSVAIKNGPTITVDESKMMSLQDFYFQCFMGEHLLLALREQLNDGTLSSVSLGPDEYTTLEIDEHDGVTRMTGEIKGFGKTKYPVYFHKVDLRHIEALYEQLYNDARAKWIKYKEGTALPEELEDICAPLVVVFSTLQFSANEWRWFNAGTAAYLHRYYLLPLFSTTTMSAVLTILPYLCHTRPCPAVLKKLY